MIRLKIGDWVYTTQSGIWQIYRIEKYICYDFFSEKEIEQSTYFVKRFLNNSFKKSFSESSFHIDHISLIEGVELEELIEFISQNKELYNKFTNYEPKILSSVFNTSVVKPKGKTTTQIANLIPTNRVFRESEIRPFLEELNITSKYSELTAQFVSEGYVIQDGYLVYKFNKILG